MQQSITDKAAASPCPQVQPEENLEMCSQQTHAQEHMYTPWLPTQITALRALTRSHPPLLSG